MKIKSFLISQKWIAPKKPQANNQIDFQKKPNSKHSYKKSKSKIVQKDSDLAYADSRQNNQGKVLALGHSKDKSSNRGGGHGGGNGGGKGGGKK